MVLSTPIFGYQDEASPIGVLNIVLNQEEINLKRVFYLIDMARAILTGNAKSDFGD